MKTSPVPERLYSCREVARHIGTSDDTVRRLITGGFLDGVRIGRRCLRVPASALARYLQGREPARRLVVSGGATATIREAEPRPPVHSTDAVEADGGTPSTCVHEWAVFSTVPADVSLLVQCVECGAYGRVTDPDEDEWRRAFHAPSNPYHWPHGDRVELLPGKQEDETKRHVRRRPAAADESPASESQADGRDQVAPAV